MWHRSKIIISFMVFLSISISALAQERHEGEIIIRFKADVEEAQMTSTMDEFKLVMKKELMPQNKIYLCKIKHEERRDFNDLLSKLNAHPDIEYAEPNWKVRALDENE